MLSKEQREANKSIVITKLESTNRPGMDVILAWLDKNEFYEAPASTRYHGCYEGGLVQHSLNLHYLYVQMVKETGIECETDSQIIAPLLHDICKVGAYLKNAENTKTRYRWNRQQPKGHALLSLVRIAKCGFNLTIRETTMIQYHMGIYGLEEFDPGSGKGEYPLRGGGLVKAWVDPAIKVMYFCDEFVTMQEKKEEGL